MAVKLGYENAFRDPLGLPDWKERGLPTQTKVADIPPLATGSEGATGRRAFAGWGALWILAGVFLGGLALNLTPCVYPMIPITVSYFGGRVAQGEPGQAKLLAHGLCYLGGLALTNSILGVAAAFTGSLMGALLQNAFVLMLVSGVLLVFASSLFGFWELRMPSFLTQAANKTYSGYFGSLFMGLTLGVVAAPCIGPFVLGLLAWVAATGSPWVGFLVFFFLSLGLGLPLFLLAMFSGQLQKLPRAGGWMIWVRRFMGWVLVGMAVYFIRPVLPGFLRIALPVAVAAAAGLHLGWLDRSQASFKAFPWIKTLVGLACFAVAAYWGASWAVRGPGIEWLPYSEQTFQTAKQQEKPIIVDFYADWCAPCRELESKTFHDPGVVREAKENFVMIKVDLTRGNNPQHEELVEKYGVKGVPTVVFLNSQGQENESLRLVDYLAPDKFLERMRILYHNSQ